MTALNLIRALIIASILNCVGCTTQLFFPWGFTRLRWHSTAVAQGKLFIDSGSVWHKSSPSAEASPYTTSATWIIDLKTSWRNDTVVPLYATKPENFPFSGGRWLWWDPVHEILQSFGGVQTTSQTCGARQNFTTWRPPGIIISGGGLPSPPNALWELRGPYSGSPAKWTVGNKNIQPPTSIASSQGSPLITTPSQLLSLGGLVSDNCGYAWGSPGLATYDFTNQTWQNISVPITKLAGYTAFNKGIYLPEFGVVVYVGGYSSTNPTFLFANSTNNLLSMARVIVYDIDSQKWAFQPTSGILPPVRWGFCAVGVEDRKSGGYDIFIHGGIGGLSTNGELAPSYDPDLANVWVLSIPSFKWTKVPDSTADSMRFLHQCERGLTRQMIVVGGDNPQKSRGQSYDPWTNGLGVFDMGELKWVDSYDADAPEYERPSLLVKANEQTYPFSWAEPWMKDAFENNTLNRSTISNNSTDHSTNSTGGLSAGAIAGISVGISGIVLLAAVIGCVCWFRKRRDQRSRTSTERTYSKRYYAKPELDADETQRPARHSEIAELPGQVEFPSELETTESPQELGNRYTS